MGSANASSVLCCPPNGILDMNESSNAVTVNGCSTVGKADASETRAPWFESYHRKIVI